MPRGVVYTVLMIPKYDRLFELPPVLFRVPVHHSAAIIACPALDTTFHDKSLGFVVAGLGDVVLHPARASWSTAARGTCALFSHMSKHAPKDHFDGRQKIMMRLIELRLQSS